MFHITAISNNKKTGPIAVSTSGAQTCPTSCPFNNANEGGCYADSGPLAMHWRKVTSGERGTAFDVFLQSVRKIQRNALWRHNQAGDLAGMGDKIDADALERLTAANRGRKGFTYTHKPLTPSNVDAIEHANANGFTVNVSANSLAHADEYCAATSAPVVAVVPEDWNKRAGKTAAGNRFVQCPATVSDDVTCASCGLCQKQRTASGARRPIVLFPAHGASKRKASAIASA